MGSASSRGGRRIVSFAHVAALAVAAVACVTDLRESRIPNTLTFGALLLAVIAHSLLPQGEGWKFAALGALAGGAVFFPFFALGGMGAGDVKLMAALGGWLGWQPALLIALYGALAGGVLALALAWAHGYLRTAFSNIWRLLTHWWLIGIQPLPDLTLEHSRGPRLAYAVPIFIGLMVTLWRS